MARRDPADLLDEIADLDTFLTFVEALIEDRADEVERQQTQPIDPFGRGPNGWENHSIQEFLFAAQRWAEDTRMGQTQGLSEGPSWRAFAMFLYCGKIYE